MAVKLSAFWSRLARRRTVSPSMAVACLALFVAMSGTAYAAATIGSAEVINNSLQSIDLKDGAAARGVDVVNDTLTGVDVSEATLNGVGRKMLFNAPAANTVTKTKFLTFAGYDFKAACLYNGSATLFFLWANGPWGVFAHTAVHSANSPNFPNSEGSQIFATDRQFLNGDNADQPLMPLGDPEAAPYMLYVDGMIYRRAHGSAFIWTANNSVIELEFDIVVNNDPSNYNGRSCYLVGVATKGI